MSKDNLILFPKKSNSIISMSENEAKWMISASILVVLTIAIGINSTLFSPSGQYVAENEKAGSRSIASINPIFKVSWEKKAFEVLKSSKERDLANIGKQPSAFDKLAFGILEGKYAIRLEEGKIAEIKFAAENNNKPKHMKDRKAFVEKNLNLFAQGAYKAETLHYETTDDTVVESFQLKNSQGQDLRVVQVLSDKDNNLISMTVQ